MCIYVRKFSQLLVAVDIVIRKNQRITSHKKIYQGNITNYKYHLNKSST